jgi:hypothetical protein
LIPYARNARTHSDAQVAQIADRHPVTSAAQLARNTAETEGNPALIAPPAPRVWLLRRTLRPPQRRRGAATAGVALVTGSTIATSFFVSYKLTRDRGLPRSRA